LVILVVLILIILLLIAIWKWFLYYCTLCGIIHHYGIKFNYSLDVVEIKEITNQAAKRVIDDFLRLLS